jgi:hypothetical protein
MTDHTFPGLRSRRRPALLAVIMPLALIAAGCGGDDDDSTATGADAGSSGGDGLSIDVTTPADAADVGEPFEIDFDTSVDLGEPDTGLHHVHLYYDGETAEGDYDLAYENSFSVERELGSGEHTVEAVIANADHSLTDARDEITVNVTDTSGSGGGGSDDDSDPYGY